MNQLESAIKEYKKHLLYVNAEMKWDTYNALGLAYKRLGNFGKAKSYYEESMKLNRNESNVRNYEILLSSGGNLIREDSTGGLNLKREPEIVEFSVCANCGHVAQKKLLKCAACKSVYYCNRACQKNHWLVHKKECKKMKESQK